MSAAALPAMANAHSHAFQVALRGRGERPVAPGRDDFWSWREAMYATAETLDPERMRELAGRAYREMAAAGYGAVGEFHYVHHRPDGTPWDDPNALAVAVAEAAADAGLAIVLLPAAYHRGGPGVAAAGAQRRFSDASVDAFLERVDALREWADGRPGVAVGIAAHSVRAVPAAWLERIAAYAEEHGLVRHVHAAEQRRELEECEREHGCSPIELLHRTGFLSPRTTVVHGIHVSGRDVERIAAADAIVVTCPTTEGNLGDGWFPALRYRDAGVRIAIGSDSQVRIDPFEEVRALETAARRERETRSALLASEPDLWARLAANGMASLGLAGEAPGTIELDLGHPSLAGVEPGDLPYAACTCAAAGAVAALRPANSIPSSSMGPRRSRRTSRM